jgi:hypothetical protein
MPSRNLFHTLNTRGNGGRNTSQIYVEILSFRHFSRHMVFERSVEKDKNKLIKSWVPVSFSIS